MSEERAPPRVPEVARESEEESFFGDDLAPMWRRAESRSSQRTEGERGRGPSVGQTW